MKPHRLPENFQYAICQVLKVSRVVQLAEVLPEMVRLRYIDIVSTRHSVQEVDKQKMQACPNVVLF